MKGGTIIKQAWEIETDLREQAIPRLLSEEEQTWKAIRDITAFEDNLLSVLWSSRVPGSGAPERLIVGAVQAARNKGLDVTQATEMLHTGLDAFDKKDMQQLNMKTAAILESLENAKKDPESSYWKYRHVDSWEEHSSSIRSWPKIDVDTAGKDFEDKIYASWLGQICAGAFGTPIEGFTSRNILDTFRDLTTYVRKPNTYNDDITYEVAFLEVFVEKGYMTSSKDIALKWVALVPFGWSAELIALRNIRLGVFPPESGRRSNPFSEWIGAQMRGAIIGMVTPGNTREAARLAWEDGVVSHTGNGVLGETFNAILCSLAFEVHDLQELLRSSAELIPEGTQFRSVVDTTLALCRDSHNWKAVWEACEDRYKHYNWIHAYPNIAAEIVGLWFGDGDFVSTMEIIGGCGLDVDCNAAQAGAILGILEGTGSIPFGWSEPIGDTLETYMRGMEKLSIKELSRRTVESVRVHSKKS